jgi:hypothetical protein
LLRYFGVHSFFLNTKRKIFFVGSILVLIAATRIPRVNGYMTQLKIQGHGSILNSVLYIFNQIVEALASCFGYWIPQSGAGPGTTGIIGISLAALVIGVSLQGQTRQQLLQTAWVMLFISAVVYWGNIVIGPRVAGNYIISITAFLIGLTVMNANAGPEFMLARKSRNFVISIISISHWIVLDGRISGFAEPSPIGNIYAPWLDLSFAPLLISIIGVTGFTVLIYVLWKLIDLDLKTEIVS